MNIVFDNIVFSLQKSGGISVVWKEILSRFIALGMDRLLFVEHPTDYNNMSRQDLNIKSSDILVKNTRLLALERYINPRIKMDRPFIFHSSYFRYCRNKHAVNVTTVHDFTYDYFFKGKRKWAFIHIWQRNRAIRNSDAVICISENTKKDLLALVPDIDPQKVSVIYNGISTDYHEVDNKYDGFKDYLLFVGSRASYKNARWLAAVLKDTGYKILFCGAPMTEEEIDYYNQVIGAENYLIITYPTNEELNRIYNSVKCLVYPSSYEGFGIPILEAQRAGCPVIALNTSSIPEVIGKTPLLMSDLSKDEFLEKLSLLDDEETREEIIMAGRDNVKRFSWDKTFKAYRELYVKLLEEREYAL